MNIGIDIDNTITEVEDELNNAAYQYALTLGKDIDNFTNDLDDKSNIVNVCKNKLQFSQDELKFFLRNIQEKITNEAKPRANAVEVIKKLKEEGNKIFIITARNDKYHDNPYLLSKSWLDKNDIEYDKLIVNAKEKAIVCKSENIEVFIDDQLDNCLDIAKEGIKVIRISNVDSNSDDIVNLNDWSKIYKFIKTLR